jgi:hypothetical protein
VVKGMSRRTVSVQPPAGSITLIDRESVFVASRCQNRPDLAGRLERVVSLPPAVAIWIEKRICLVVLALVVVERHVLA